MTFDLPDHAQATFDAQARLFSNDLQAMVQPASLTGVKIGCEVTAQVSPNMTLAVALGTVYFLGVEVAVAAGNVTITTAHGSQPRIDIVVVNSSGVKSVVAGAAAEFPLEPATPASSVMLAQVYVPANDTAIGATQVRDRRIIVMTPVLTAQKDISYYKGRTSTAGFESWYLGGVLQQASVNGIFGDPTGPNQLVAMPFISTRGGTLDRIAFRVHQAFAGASARVGIYDSVVSEVDFYPNARLVDSGSISVASTGMKVSTISVSLTTNRLYWFVFEHNATVNQMFVNTISSTTPLLTSILGVGADFNVAQLSVAWKHAFNFAALPATFPDTARTVLGSAPAVAVRYSA